MNAAGLENRAGELMKEMEGLLETASKVRRDRGDSKLQYEDVEERISNLQAFIYTNLMQDKTIDWANPNPVLSTDGKPMPEFEAQYRSMFANWMIQKNEAFQTLMAERNEAKKLFYDSERLMTDTMERIGVAKAEMGLIAALLRLADGDA